MLNQLFVYGTLQVPDVLQKVIGRQVPGQPAILHGYRRGRVDRADFPGIVSDPAHQVSGLLLTGITGQELHFLDHYEGELYRRESKQVVCADQTVQCWVYIIARWAQGRVTEQAWSLEEFKAKGRRGRLTYRQ